MTPDTAAASSVEAGEAPDNRSAIESESSEQDSTKKLDLLIGAMPYAAWGVVSGLLVMAAVARVRSLDMLGMPWFYESGDSAGDALQARKGLATLLFTTGHHTDVGAAHPGPFALWIKAAAEIAGGYSATPVIEWVLVLFVVLKVIAVAAAAAFVAAALRAPLAAPVFTAVSLGGVWLASVMQPTGIAIAPLSSWLALALCGCIVGIGGGVRGALTAAAATGGALVHVHTPAAPAGGLVLIGLGVVLVARRRSRGWDWWGSLAVSCAFLAPLVLRMALEWPWPLTYLEAAATRSTAVANGAERARFELLGEYLGLPPMAAFALLVAATCACLAAAIPKRTRAAALMLGLVTGWAVVVALASPPNQTWATELWWITGVVGFWAGFIAASASAVFWLLVRKGASRALRNPLPLLSICSTLLVATLAFLLLPGFPEKFSSPVPGGDGTSYGTNPYPAVEALTREAGARKIVIVATQTMLRGGYPVTLELERAGVDFCVSFPRQAQGGVPLDLFYPESLRCGTSEPDSYVLAAFDSEGSVQFDRELFKQEEFSDSAVRVPSYRLGVPNCEAPPGGYFQGCPWGKASRGAG